MGGVWEWTSSVLERHEGFEPMALYPAYTGLVSLVRYIAKTATANVLQTISSTGSTILFWVAHGQLIPVLLDVKPCMLGKREANKEYC